MKRVPPQDLEAERALLGAVMLNKNAIYDVVDIVSPDDFYANKHKDIFEAMLTLFNKGEPIDLVTVSTKLKEQGNLNSIGGRAYLTELIGVAPSASNATFYAHTTKTKHILRSLIEASAEINEVAFQEADDVEQVLDLAQSKIYEIASTGTLQKFKSIGDELKGAWERLEKLQETKDSLRGVPTGFKALDDLLSGFQRSDLVILAARPSMGKTALALDIARQAAVKHKIPVGIFSLEMSSQQLTDRMLSAEARVSSWKLRTGHLSTDNEYDSLRNAMDRLSEAPIFIDDKAERTVLQMRSIARRLKAENGLELVIVDYLQLITPSSTRSSDSMVQQVTEISRSLKAMARELDVPVIALSQLSRAVEQRRGQPRLSDLRDSGSIEQDADVVMFIHREDKMQEDAEKNNIAEILVEKHRNGPVGKIELYFDEDKTSFVELDKNITPDFVVSESGDVDF